MVKEKIDKEFLRQTAKNIEKGNMEYQKYIFRLLLVGGTVKDRQRAVNEFEDRMNKMEIRKGNTDLRIEMLSRVGDRIKIKPYKDDAIKQIAQMAKADFKTILTDEIEVIVTQSGKPLEDEEE